MNSAEDIRYHWARGKNLGEIAVIMGCDTIQVSHVLAQGIDNTVTAMCVELATNKKLLVDAYLILSHIEVTGKTHERHAEVMKRLDAVYRESCGEHAPKEAQDGK